MRRTIGRRLWVTLAVLAGPVAPATAQPVDPSAVGSLPGYYLATGSFVLVLLAGAALRIRDERFVDAAVDSSMDRPHVSILYGGLAYVIVLFLGALGLTQLAQVGLGTSFVVVGIAASVGVAVVILAGLGYAVVGAWLSGLWGPRQGWNGLVFGAALSAVGWVLFPFLVGVAVWLAVAAVGIGGPVREWVHDERPTVRRAE